MLMARGLVGIRLKSLAWMMGVILVMGCFTPASASWYQLPSFLQIPDVLSYDDEEEIADQVETPFFYAPDAYDTHKITGYGAAALALIAMVTQDDSGLHKGSGIGAAVLGVAAGASGHVAYGEGIDFSDGWTPENIHVGAGYIATAALVLTAALGAADEEHGGVGGFATAAVAVPVIVFAF